MAETEPPKEHILAQEISKFLENNLDRWKLISGNGADIFLNSYNEDPDSLSDGVFRDFMASGLNTMGFTEADIKSFRLTVREQVDAAIKKIREETEKFFANYFENHYYYTAFYPGEKEQRREVIASPGTRDWLKRSKGEFMTAILRDFSKPSPSHDSSNRYHLSEGNLEFLKPMIEQLTNQLILDINQSEK